MICFIRLAVRGVTRSQSYMRCFGSATQMPLSKVAKVELLEAESPENVQKIWREHHITKTCVSAVLPATTYRDMHNRLLDCPRFLIPLPQEGKGGGYDLVYMQHQGNAVLMTHLEHYKTYQQAALPCLTLYFFDELAKSKGLVLMRGEVDINNLTIEQATFLTNKLQIYYLSPSNYNLVETFNKQPQKFDVVDLIRNMDLIMSGR
eukprot:TRINITY_DN14034_c0_g1_i1.p1 TRINITY_DN14034_c0_g1~~TRINITY_DN14034_c0_g1_i1.p1  ORF type:complete len:205 (-),score=27.85 TRINITY_DN14034_c0_g1_i1:57-671(-)